ncbi:MAG: T9SS type A sorting domain-containing protein [Bacteroidales bacterium]|nr:T9SS type A sorting domain-containing protein [Bacteroidales bacterium]
MKATIAGLALLLGLGNISLGQTYKVAFTYDGAGNRTSKTITMTSTSNPKSAEEEPGQYTEELGGATLTIYPNPTQGQLTIDLGGAEFENGQVQVLDYTGRQLQRQPLAGDRTNVDISAYPAATYILLIEVDGKATQWNIVKK